MAGRGEFDLTAGGVEENHWVGGRGEFDLTARGVEENRWEGGVNFIASRRGGR